MAQKIAILNFKGGVGKTTTAINLSAALALSKKHVLLIDLDGQCNTSLALDYNVGDGNNIYDALMDETEETVLPVYEFDKNFDFVPASIQLGNIAEKISNRFRKEEILSRLIKRIESNYDFIIIDCPPSEGILNFNAMAASDHVIIPVDGELFSLQGITNITTRIQRVKEMMNPNLEILGFLFTQYRANLTMTKQILSTLKDSYPGKVLNSRIRQNSALVKTPAVHQTIFQYDIKSNGAEDYKSLCKEILKRLKK